MRKIADFLSKVQQKQNPYMGLSECELRKSKEDLLKQREFCYNATMVTDRDYSRNYDGHVISRQHEDAYMIQIKSIDREINRIDAELRRRKEQENSASQPGLD